MCVAGLLRAALTGCVLWGVQLLPTVLNAVSVLYVHRFTTQLDSAVVVDAMCSGAGSLCSVMGCTRSQYSHPILMCMLLLFQPVDWTSPGAVLRALRLCKLCIAASFHVV